MLAAATKFRQPVSTRLAHQYVNDLRCQGNLADESSVQSIDPVV